MESYQQFRRLVLFLILGVVLGGFAFAQTTVTVSPATSNVLRGQSFSVSVNVGSVANLQGSHVTLSFDNSVVQYTGAAAGSLFPVGSFFQSSPTPGPAVNSIVVDQALLSAGTVNGSGTLFTASFSALVTGTSPATITADLRDNNNNSIPVTITSGTINVANPVPTTTGISPTSKTSDDLAFVMTVNGTNFFPDSKVRFNGSDRVTTYVSGTQLTAQILTSDLAVAGPYPITVFNPAPGGGTSNSQTFTVLPGALHHFAVGGFTSPQTAGTPFGVTITAQDANNNTVTGFEGTVSLTTTAGTIAPTTSGSFVSGVRVEPVTVTLAGPGATISVNDGSGHTGTSASFTVNPGNADHFTISTISSPQTAGVPFAITITAKDANNNVATGFVSTVNLTTTAGTITPLVSGAFVGGVRTENVSVTQSGTGKTISVNDGSGHTGTSNAFDVSPAAIDHFDFGAIAGPQVAGTPFSITITAKDIFGNTVTGFVGNVNLTTTAGTITPTPVGPFVAGVLTTNVTVTQAGSGKTITADDGSGHSGTSGGFTVNPAALANFLVEASGGGSIPSQTAGAPFNIRVTARDTYGNTRTDFTGTVDITSTGTLSVGGGTTASFVGGVLSSHIVTISNTGTFTITATRTSGIETGTSNSFAVNAGVLHHFAIATISSPQTAGAPFNITITAQDINNNTVPSFVGTVNLTTTAGTITPLVSGAFVSGVRTENVSVTQSGTGKTISVNDGSGHTGTSNAFDVNPGAVHHFAVSNIPSPQVAGTPFNITITAQDVNNNTVTSFASTVALSTTAGSVLPSNSGLFGAGVRVEAVYVTQAGSGKTITVDDGSGHTGISNTFSVNPGSLHHFSIAAISTPQTAGTPFDITITAKDQFENTVTSFVSTVNLFTTAGTISPLSSGSFSSGVRVQSVTVTQAGTGKDITVNDGAAHTGGSNTFDVLAGALHHFAFATISSPQAAGASFNVSITAQDLNNNTVTTFAGTVNLTTTAGTITPLVSGSFSSGVRTETVTVTLAGTGKTITADDGAGHTGTSNAFDVNVGGLHHFAISSISSPQIAGTPFSITITAQDLNNNTVTSFTGSVPLATTAGTISPSTTGAFVAGVKMLNVTVTQSGTGKTISVDDGAGHTATSNTFTVDPGALHHFSFATIPSMQAGAPSNIALTAQDVNNNTVTLFTGTVTLTTTAGTISPTVTGNFVAGVRTEAVTVTQSGLGKTITANDGAGHTGTSNAFDVSSGPLFDFLVELAGGGPIPTQIAGVPFALRVTARDALGNTVTTFTGTVNVTSTGTLSGGSGTSASFTAGVLASHSVTISNTGTFNITVTRTGGAETGTSNSFSVFNANYTITASAGAHGSISPSGVVTVPYNTDKTFIMTPTLGYHVGGLTIDGTPVNPANSYVFTGVNADHTIAATFAQDCYTVSGPGVVNVDANGDGTTDIKLDFAVVPNGGGSVCIAVYFAPPSGAPAPPSGSIPYYFVMTTSMPAHSFRATVTGDMNGIAGYAANSHVMYYNTITSSWVMEASTYAASNPAFSGHPSYTFTTDHFTNYTFVNTAVVPANMFVSGSSAAVQGTIYPNDSWGTTAYEPDWAWSGSQPVSFWLVPEVGAQFGKSDLTIEWDASMMTLASVDFGAAGSPNGLYGSGQGYTHTESFDQGYGANTLTIHAQRTDNSNFTIAANDYIAKVNFILLKPGHSAVAVIGASFQKFGPTTDVNVIGSQGEVKAYLGDFARVGNPNLGDGVIDFQDLSPWSISYWSGTPGFTLANYKVKFDIGPTLDHFVFSLPQTDTKIDFEDLVIFSISYGQSISHQLPKLAEGDSASIELGAPVAHGTETWIPLHVSGNITDLRALSIEVTGHFSSFLGVENGEMLAAYTTPVAVMKKAVEGIVSVDLAVLGLDAHGLQGQGDVIWLRFAGSPRIHLQKVEGRTSNNTIVTLQKRKGAGDSQPTTYELLQNYPNPFNPTTTINYVLPDDAQVTIEVYNLLGERVSTLVNEVKTAGFYQTTWNGLNNGGQKVGSGVYFYRLSARGSALQSHTIVKKMVLVK